MEEAVKDSVARNVGHSMEYQIVHPNGDLKRISCVWEVLSDEKGLPTKLFGTAQDITEVRRAQEETYARQKLETIGTLATGIAHDFNNLLGGVLVQAEVALQELATGLNPHDELKAIRNVALRGSEIVRELMIYAGKEGAVVEFVNVSQIVKEMLELLKVSVSKHAKLKADLGKDLPAVRANAARLRQIVMNLVTNASEAIGDQDGEIRVATTAVHMGGDMSEVFSSTMVEGEYVLLEVSDTGRGIPLELQAKVFDPFFTTKSAGHGLGLAVVQGIVRGLGGSIDLTSEPGTGTTFQIWLPCADATTEPATDHPSLNEESTLATQGATILLVEDEDPLRRPVARILREAGFQVFEAADGSSAIELLQTNGSKIDVILLDVTIPGASSQEVIEEAAKIRPDIKVILNSAYSQEMIADAMTAPQVHSFIRKPYQLMELVQTLQRSLSLSASAQSEYGSRHSDGAKI
jgi:signal transduction histidine kinase/ActR/RegA family two-component response regulator